eukprot:1681446-Karenia_brevis.AAC.1
MPLLSKNEDWEQLYDGYGIKHWNMGESNAVIRKPHVGRDDMDCDCAGHRSQAVADRRDSLLVSLPGVGVPAP